PPLSLHLTLPHSFPTRRSSDLIFVLNKSDREGADRLEEQLHAMLSMAMPKLDRSSASGENGWHPPVVRTVATENKGIEKLADAIDRKSTRLNSSHGSISYAVFC